MSVPDVVELLLLEGVSRVVITSDEPASGAIPTSAGTRKGGRRP